MGKLLCVTSNVALLVNILEASFAKTASLVTANTAQCTALVRGRC